MCGESNHSENSLALNDQIKEQDSCSNSSRCNASKSLELPSHVKNFNLNELSNLTMKYPSEEDVNYLFKVRKKIIVKIKISFRVQKVMYLYPQKQRQSHFNPKLFYVV
jgi:hypothetical protein